MEREKIRPCVLENAAKGRPDSKRSRPQRGSLARAFTLMELILVMALLTATIGVAIPRLASFFRGRMLDSEARRVLALSRHAQARATSEGVPIHLWVDVRNGEIGIEADPSYHQPSISEPATEIDSAIRLELSHSSEGSPRRDKSAAGSGVGGATKSSKLPAIIFKPDGTIDPSSPDKLVLRDSDDHTVVVEKSRNRLTYEISGR